MVSHDGRACLSHSMAAYGTSWSDLQITESGIESEKRNLDAGRLRRIEPEGSCCHAWRRGWKKASLGTYTLLTNPTKQSSIAHHPSPNNDHAKRRQQDPPSMPDVDGVDRRRAALFRLILPVIAESQKHFVSQRFLPFLQPGDVLR